MAKLSARGRHEIARYEKQVEKATTPESYDTIRERMYFAFMSDNHVLYQLKVWRQDGQTHLYPWKHKGKYTPENFQKAQENLLAKGYTRV